jgi:5'(3')-deoxyribonucleotidase
MNLNNNKKIRIYVDLDDTMCDYSTAFHDAIKRNPDIKQPQSQYDFFRKLKPIKDAIESFLKLSNYFDVWILTRPSMKNPLCYTEKRIWVEENLGYSWVERLIISPDKSLLKGHYLIDDHYWKDFEGEKILFGSEEFPDWKSVMEYFEKI